jgi:Tfp pilus assembly protein PilF
MPPDERESAYDLFQRGTALLAERHPGAASVLLERCLAMEPGKASIREALARAYFDQGAHAQAADTFQAIVDADPLAHYAHFGLGLSRIRLGDAAAGRTHLRMAVFLKPENDDYRRALRRTQAGKP